MDITAQELERLNFYRASELQGGLLLAHLAQRARDPELMLKLTRHGAEEVTHAELWTQTILAVGGKPWPTRDTYQARYARVIGSPSSLIHILVLTQVFERRVYRHFMRHLSLPGTHPEVQKTLRRMIEEEKDHLSWVWSWLKTRSQANWPFIQRLLAEYTAADADIYRSLEVEYGFARAA